MKLSCLSSCLLVAALAALPACQSSNGEQQSAPPDPAEMAAIMERLATPGDHHRALDPLVGDFRAEVTVWSAPGTEPERSSGRMSNRWIFGGRFLQSEYDGTLAMGGQSMPFQGLGITGYDNGAEEYLGYWIDTMGTMMMPLAHGHASNDGRTITLHRTMQDPMMGGEVTMREILTIESEDQHSMEMFMQSPGQDEFRMMRIEYTRI